MNSFSIVGVPILPLLVEFDTLFSLARFSIPFYISFYWKSTLSNIYIQITCVCFLPRYCWSYTIVRQVYVLPDRVERWCDQSNNWTQERWFIFTIIRVNCTECGTLWIWLLLGLQLTDTNSTKGIISNHNLNSTKNVTQMSVLRGPIRGSYTYLKILWG